MYDIAMRTMGFLLLFVGSVVFANIVFHVSPWPAPKANSSIIQNDFSSKAQLKKFSYRGPVDDCGIYHSLYDRSKKNLTECTLNYVHYYPNADQKFKKNEDRSQLDLKIGSFNLFHLGDNQAPMKSFPLMASIINQWDIVGVQEMMPLGLIAAEDNQKLSELLTKAASKIKFPFSDWAVITPGYLLVLNELQKLDSSWALILQSTSEGEGGSGEMAGFFYRSSLAQLKEWDYCPLQKSLDIQSGQQQLNLGCLTQVSDSVKKLTSRLAFAAYFQSGDFDFIGLTTHSRFRPSLLESDVAAQKQAICSQHFQPQKCKIAKDHVGRFFEIFAVADQISEMKEKAQDADVIFMGDFNLELTPKLLEIWKAALRPAPGLKPFQQEPTTVGIKFSRMVSSYDHFILDTKFTSECDPESVAIFDFVKVAKIKSDKIGQQISAYFNEKKRVQLATEKRNLTNFLVKTDKSDSGFIVRALTDIEKADAFGSLDVSLERMKFNEHSLMLQLISDHIPVVMSCRKDLQDDD